MVSETLDPREKIPLFRNPNLALILNTPKGRGVFATSFIPKRTVIDVCPVLVLDPSDKAVESAQLYNYTYNWPCRDERSGKTFTAQAVILGLGSMFNHSRLDQNVGFHKDIQRSLATYTALRDISAGEELCISYGTKLAFVDADAEEVNGTVEDGIDVLSRIDLC